MLTDQELFSRISSGDGYAFERIFRKYFNLLKSNAFKLLKSEFWAEEVAQEVFLHIWDGRNKLSEVESPSAYLYRMTANHCLNRIRRQELETKMQYLVQTALHGNVDVLPENRYDLERVETLIGEAIEQLPEQAKRIFLLQQQEGLSYYAIAERLGISKNTVRNHMVRALRSIRKYLQVNGDFFLLLFSTWYLF